MSGELQARLVRGRDAKQERSERTRGAIVEAVLAVLAEDGVAGLTHRRAAQRSGGSLAATTYYFATKQDMIAAASNELLLSYLGLFSERVEAASGRGPADFRRFVAEMVGDSVSDFRQPTLAWCEIMLDGARHPEARKLARLWFQRMIEVWQRCARRFGLADAEAAGPAGMDFTLGALLHGLALGLDRDVAEGAFAGVPEPALRACDSPPAGEATANPARPSRRSGVTRERILEAAIHLLSTEGAAAVNYRAVAAEAGLTPGAPAYHFASVEALLAEAQALLFERSKARYRELVGSAFKSLDLTTLSELSAVIFQSEATEFHALNLATYALWLQAAREPTLRPLVQEIALDMHSGWTGLLEVAGAPRGGAEPLMIQYLFVGAFVRALACGVTASDLVVVRSRLRTELGALIEGRHWIQSAALGTA
jgi:DNA-binding transcriptional regulator YbjK